MDDNSSKVLSDLIVALPSFSAEVFSGVNGFFEDLYGFITTMDKQNKDYKLERLRLDYNREIEIKKIDAEKELKLKYLEIHEAIKLKSLDLVKHVFDRKMDAFQEHNRYVQDFYRTAMMRLNEEKNKLNEELLLTSDNKKYAILSNRLSEISKSISEMSIQYNKYSLNYNHLIETLELPEVQENIISVGNSFLLESR